MPTGQTPPDESALFLRRLIPNYPIIAFFSNLERYRSLVIVLTIVGFFSAALRFGTVILLGELITHLPSLTPSTVIWYYLPLWAMCLLSAQGLDYFTRRFGEPLPQKIGNITQQRISSAALAAPLSRLRALSRERLLASIGTYCGHVERCANEWCWTMIRRIFSTSALVVILFIQNPFILLLNLLFVTLYLTIAFRISAQIAPLAAEQRAENLSALEQQTAFVLGLPFLKRFQAELFFESTMDRAYARSWRALDALKRFHAWRWFLQLSLFDALTLATIGYGAYQVSVGKLSLGFLILLKWSFDELWVTLVYVIELYVRIIHERQDAALLQQQFVALGLGKDTEMSEVEAPKEKKSSSTKAILTDNTTTQWERCELTAITISYDGERKITIPSFTIRRGDVVAIMGESGIGKTTLIEVLGRFSSFDGTYTVDGVSYPLSCKSPFVAMMITPHDPFFKTTLRENLTLGRSIPDSQLHQLLQDLCADFALDKLDAIIGEGTVSFSTGEEQRLRLARALLTSPDLLLLDEPLTGIDDETRGRIISHLPRLIAGRTTVIVTHREEETTIAHRVIRLT